MVNFRPKRIIAQGQNTRSVPVPVPMSGMNTTVALSQMSADQTVLTYNLRSTSYGMGPRTGYAQWCQPVPAGDGVKTIIPVNGIAGDHSDDKIFVCTSDGVYDVSLATMGVPKIPIKVLDFALKDSDAGWVSWLHFSTDAANKAYLLICDLSNGYYYYDVDLNTWTKVLTGAGPTQVSGADPTKFVFVTSWKNRLWFVQKDSTRSYYFASRTFVGPAILFDWGPKMRSGGFLKGIYNWTLNGGLGVDDYLVGIGSEGDVLVYQGTDPADVNSFNIHGTWQLGVQPRNRRIAADFGGDLLVASQYGIIPMSRLVAGLPLDDENAYVTATINSLYRLAFRDREDLFGFEMKNLFSLGGIMVVWPKIEGRESVQLFYTPNTKAWTIWTGLPALTVESVVGTAFMGTLDNQVYTLDAPVDNIRLDGLTQPLPITFTMLTAFSDLGQPTQFKRLQFMRPIFTNDAAPAYSIVGRFDYDISPDTSVNPDPIAASNFWDVGLWDTALWSGGYQNNQPMRGGAGMGRTLALLLKGTTSSGDVVLTGFDVMFDSGGLL